MNDYPLVRGAELAGEGGRRYIILEQIGRPGNRGLAYLAAADGDDVAIVKLPNLDGNQNRMPVAKWVAETSEDFWREKHASDRLAHSSVADRYPHLRHLATASFRIAAGDVLELPYIIRDRLDAMALDKWGEQRAQGTFAGIDDPALWRHICVDLAGLVAGMHEAGVVHADIRPPNVRIKTADDTISTHILDFGQSRIGTSLAAACSVRFPYYAPERIMGPWDHRADLYSLGGILFYSATGAVPPSPFADPEMDVRDRFRNDERVLHDRDAMRAKLLDVLAARNILEVYPHAIDVIADCMNPDVEKRTHDARAVAVAL